MSGPPTVDILERLRHLEEILARWATPAAGKAEGATEPAQFHLANIPLDRIRALTVELQRRGDGGNDEVDALAMRILLNDYTAAVAHLRAVARATEARLAATSGLVAKSRQFVRREEELAAKRAARLADDAEEEE